MQNNDYIRLNVALYPSEEIRDKAIAISKEIANSQDVHFQLDGISIIPHVTLYSPEYPSKNLDKILSVIKDISEKTQSLHVKPLRIDQCDGYIGVELEPSDQIINLHNKIVDSLNPLREDHYRDSYMTLVESNLQDERTQNIRDFGHPTVKGRYRPHLTLIRLKDEQEAEEVRSKIEWPMEPFQIDTLGVFKMGSHGTCTELIKKFQLQ